MSIQCSRRYNQAQDEEKEKLTLYCSSLFYVFTFARRVILLSVNGDVERKQNKRRCTRSPDFVTRARARARAGEGEKEKERRKKKKKKDIFARTTSGDDLRERIDRNPFAMLLIG